MTLSCYITVDQLAGILGYSRQEITRKIWRGQIKAERVGKYYFIHKNQLKTLKKKGEK